MAMVRRPIISLGMALIQCARWHRTLTEIRNNCNIDKSFLGSEDESTSGELVYSGEQQTRDNLMANSPNKIKSSMALCPCSCILVQERTNLLYNEKKTRKRHEDRPSERFSREKGG